MSAEPVSQKQSDSPKHSLSNQGTVVALMTLLSRISGFVRDIVLSHFFGASGLADAFFVAFRIPNLFRRLFAEGAFAQSFVPVLSDYKSRKSRAELLFFIQAISAELALALFTVCIVGMFIAPTLILVFAPGFRGSEEQLSIASDMLRVCFPYLGFISLTALSGAILNSFDKFAVPAFTPVLLNVCLIAAALIIAPQFETPVMALAWGVLAAGILQFLFQFPALKRLNMLVLPKIRRKHPGVARVRKLIVPAAFAASVGQINALVDTMLASTLSVGSISWLYYSDRLMELPLGLVAVTLGTVLLPNLSRLFTSGDMAGFRQALSWGMRMGLLWAFPAAIALFVLAVPLITTIFFHGALSQFDAEMAALSLRAYAVGLFGLCMVKIMVPAYFARMDVRTPFRIGAIAVAVNIVGNLAMFTWMGHVGLAFATSMAALVNSYLLLRGLILLRLYTPDFSFCVFALKVIIASVLMVSVLFLLMPETIDWYVMSMMERVFNLALLCFAGGITYFCILLLMGIRMHDLRYNG